MLQRFLRSGALLAVSLLTSVALHAQAQFAGTYIGTFNTRQSAGGQTIEIPSTGYIAVVSSTGTINVNSGALTGTVAASGAVTLNGGTALATFGITAASIANNQLSSAYGAAVANGVSQWKFNASTSFTAAPGGGGGGGGITTNDLAASALAGKTLTITVTDGQPPLPTSGTYAITLNAAGNAYTLTNVSSTIAASSGAYTYNNFGNPNGTIQLTLTNMVAGLEPLLLSIFIQNGGGRFELNRGTSGAAGFEVGSFTIGTTPPAGGGGGGTNVSFTNGSFEGGPNPGAGWVTLGVGSTAINGWTITAGSLDYIGTAWQSSDGGRSLDLAGVGAGAIAQTFNTVAGQTYTVSFDYSGNPGYGTGTGSKDMRVSVNNTAGTAQTFTFDTTGKTLANMGWVNRTFSFTASAATTTLTFTSLTGGVYGPALDNVKVNGASGSVGASATAGAPAIVAATAPATLVGYRNKVNQTFEFTLTGATSGAVWGTDVYTDDSSLAVAAVHAGVLRTGETKTVTVTVLGGQSSYAASTRNGVTTGSWGPWSGSYSFAGAGAVTPTAATTVRPVIASGFVAGSFNVTLGGRLVIPIAISGVGPFTYQWYLNGVAISGATANPYVIDSLASANAGTYSVDVTNSAGTTRLTAGSVTVGASGAPTITLHPLSKIVAPGNTFTLLVSAQGAGNTYQWFRNGVALANETGNALRRDNVNQNDAGSYTVRVTNASGSATSNGGIVTISPNAVRTKNISSRTKVVPGSSLSLGFVIQGSGKKRLLVRAVGPTMTDSFGLPGTLANPKVEVFKQGSTVAINSNDDWAAALSPVFAAAGAFALTPNSKDAAIVLELDAGSGYSVVVKGDSASATGIVLAEVYDIDTAPTSKLANVSVLNESARGDDVLILGLVLEGEGQSTLLTRGIGPKLAAFGVPGTLADPQLQIFDGPTRRLIINDDWNKAEYQSEMSLAATFMGAFALDEGSKDASTLALLGQGNYSIQISGADGGTGQGQVEVYFVP